MCTMQTSLTKFPFYIAMLVHLLVYIRLDSIAMKLINIHNSMQSFDTIQLFLNNFFKHVSVARAPPLTLIYV